MGGTGIGTRAPAASGAGRSGAASSRLLVGAIAAPHGVRGLVKVKSFTAAPADIAAYGPLSDETGRRRITLQVMSAAGGGALICRIDGVADTAEHVGGRLLNQGAGIVERERSDARPPQPLAPLVKRQILSVAPHPLQVCLV